MELKCDEESAEAGEGEWSGESFMTFAGRRKDRKDEKKALIVV